MNAYQLIKALQEEVERETGVRPHVDLFVNSHGDLSNEKCEEIKNYIVNLSEGELKSREMVLENGSGEWTLYKAQNLDREINVSVHGPITEKVVEDVTT